jgi:hypothetical protein
MPLSLGTKDDRQMKLAHLKMINQLNNVQYNPPPWPRNPAAPPEIH